MASTEPAQPVVEEAEVTGVPDDANDLRGHHFKRLLRKPLTLALLGIWALFVMVAAAVFAGSLFIAPALVIALSLGLAVVFGIADSKAAGDFFEVYAQQRGMTLLHGRGRLPQATPLLRKGDDRYAERTLQGPLADGFDGTLALFTYEEETRDSDGDRQTNYYRYTVGLVEVKECSDLVPELYCQRKFGLRALEKFEDVFRGSKQRLKLESEVLDKKYEIFARKEQDAIWLRRLFSPSFIVWLTDSAPDKFAFELVDGTLCCYVNGHKESAAELDAIRVATGAVAKRLRDEALE